MNATDTALIHRVPLAGSALANAAPAQRSRPALLTTNGPAKTILLADDDPGVREMLGRVLQSEHYQVVLAKTGREAAAKFVADPPDLVLLDLNMPDRDGWMAFRQMNVSHPMLPVIVITARPNQYSQAVDLGVDALMEKPLNLPVLLQAIRELLDETEPERMRRLINPDFKTNFLKDRKANR